MWRRWFALGLLAIQTVVLATAIFVIAPIALSAEKVLAQSGPAYSPEATDIVLWRLSQLEQQVKEAQADRTHLMYLLIANLVAIVVSLWMQLSKAKRQAKP